MQATATTTPGRWIVHRQPAPAAALRLFCFAYAGSSAAIFRTWGAELGPRVDVCPVQLPGRGTRYGEPAYRSVGPLVQALAASLERELCGDFAFFGHSMGALISFELARELRRQGRRGPRHLYLSGRHAPQLPDPVQLSGLSDSAFVDELRRYRGTPAHILDSEELMALFLPVLRADFILCESYVYQPQPPLECPITAFGGMRDETVGEEALVAWREHTVATFKYYLFPGDHFFIHNNREAFMATLAEEVAGESARTAREGERRRA